jgi:pyrroloquinoline-quinone synthase
MSASEMTLWSPETFQTKLREVGMSRYHHLHPFHREMNAGRLSRAQIQGWAANRFYYQRNIPLKDAAILSNCPLREVRRLWLHRLTDHDGVRGEEGGIEAWLQLAEATGLTRAETLDGCHVVPGVRFAVDAYVSFARQKPWAIAVASSLTELFAPDLMKERLAAFEHHYPWVRAEGLRYFRSRLTLARNDSAEALALTLEHCATPELQREAVQALSFKCDLLWAMLDATQHAVWPAGEPGAGGVSP